MLKITVPATELWDETNEEFIKLDKPTTLQLEHSLVSLSKWESKYNRPFLSKQGMTYDETIDYIKFMTITQNVDSSVYSCLTNKIINEINGYIEAPMTATNVKDSKGKKNNEAITAELIYYWMISLNIPFECQKWHLNRLLTLIRVCDMKNQPPKKMSAGETARKYAEINAARRKQYNTKG